MIGEVEGLARVIDIIARRCWKGLAALRGEAPEPTREQLRAAFLHRPSRSVAPALRLRTARASADPKDIRDEDSYQAEFESYLSLVSWEEIVEAVRAFRKNPMTARDWEIYSRSVNLKASVQSRLCYGSAYDRLAELYDLNKSTVYEIVRRTPRCIAYMISTDPGQSCYRHRDVEGQITLPEF